MLEITLLILTQLLPLKNYNPTTKTMKILKAIIENPRVMLTIQATAFNGAKCKVGELVTWAEENPEEFKEILLNANPPKLKVEICQNSKTSKRGERIFETSIFDLSKSETTPAIAVFKSHTMAREVAKSMCWDVIHDTLEEPDSLT